MLKRIILLPCFLVIAIPLKAQFEVGASYEMRSESPTNGFGARAEIGILNWIPIVNLGLRAHFSYFSEENELGTAGVTYSREVQSYDFGLAAIGGISLGLVAPYVGVGLGSESVDLKFKDIQGVGVQPNDENKSGLSWNTLIGTKVAVIPLLKPFVEYRFSGNNLGMPSMSDRTGRIIFGVVLSF